jgi:Type II secretory pathway, component PulF
MFLELSGGRVALPALRNWSSTISNFFIAYWYVILGAIVGIIFGVKKYYGTVQGRLVIDKLLLKLPVSWRLDQKSLGCQVYPYARDVAFERGPLTRWHVHLCEDVGQ